MFGSNRTRPPAISNYADAVRVYNNIKPVRGRNPNERPLAGRSNWNLTIRTNDKEDVLIKLYRTDVVTFTKDGHILLEPYGSKLTNDIVYEILYYTGIIPVWKDIYAKFRHFTKVGGQYYHTPQYVDIFDGQIVGGHTPVNIPRVDRKALNAALKQYRFDEFKTWVMTMDKLGVLHLNSVSHRMKPTAAEIIPLLEAGPEGWGKLVSEYDHKFSSADQLLTSVRNAVRDYEDCIRYETVQSFDSCRELDNAIKAMRRYA
jgi:hypothetical protein